MMRIMCKSKIHRARITKVDLHYEGSIGIDKTLLKKADICPGEIVQVVNINNGSRFETYAIEEACRIREYRAIWRGSAYGKDRRSCHNTFQLFSGR